MKIYKLRIDGISISSISAFVREKIFIKNNLKLELSNSEKTIYFPEQTVLFTDKKLMYNVAHNIIEENDEIIMKYDNGALILKSINLYKLIIEHDVILDVYDDLDNEEIEELTTFFKDISLIHRIDSNNIFTITAQKCTLEYEYIDEIINLIEYGSKLESTLSMYEKSRYSITQREGYKKYLK